MIRDLDIDHWHRREVFHLFKEYDNPFFNVCANVEVTALLKLSRSAGLSFSIACHFLSLKAANEVEPFRCVRCDKPFGTPKAIELMIAKLGGHAMFQGAAAERLKMCTDCRVIDMHTNPDEVRITDL